MCCSTPLFVMYSSIVSVFASSSSKSCSSCNRTDISAKMLPVRPAQMPKRARWEIAHPFSARSRKGSGAWISWDRALRRRRLRRWLVAARSRQARDGLLLLLARRLPRAAENAGDAASPRRHCPCHGSSYSAGVRSRHRASLEVGITDSVPLLRDGEEVRRAGKGSSHTWTASCTAASSACIDLPRT